MRKSLLLPAAHHFAVRHPDRPTELDRGRGRDAAALPGDGPDGHDRPARTPPGGEKPVADYVKQVLEKEGIPVQLFALEANRPNVVARLKGNGRSGRCCIMGHTDTVNVDAKKWTYPPFSAERKGGYIYGRGTVDDKDNLAGALMTMLLLKRNNVPLDRDVIFLAEAGEEGATRIGIQFMVNQHCGRDRRRVLLCRRRQRDARRRQGEVRVGPDGGEDSARDSNHGQGHGRPRLGAARGQRGRPPGRGGRRDRRVDAADPAERDDGDLFQAAGDGLDARGGGALPRCAQPGSGGVRAGAAVLRKNEPRHWSMLRTSLSPTIIQGGYRSNVIPSEATANIDVRQAPDEDPAKFLELVRQVVNDPQRHVVVRQRRTPPTGRRRRPRGSTPKRSRRSSR